MSDIWRIIAELSSELHPERINAIADQVESLSGPEDLESIWQVFGANSGKNRCQILCDAWKSDISRTSKEVAAAFRTGNEMACLQSNAQRLKLVLSGPSTGVVPIRHTEQVLCEIIDNASDEIFLVSFVAYKVARIVDAMNQAIERGVKVRILLELSDEDGGAISFDSLRLIQKKIPKADYYHWKQDDSSLKGSVHAKCTVADRNVAFVSSANLTTSAMETNMEAGLLVVGGLVPIQLAAHFESLRQQGIIDVVK